MDLENYLPITNNALSFYINNAGLITLDDCWHLPLLQMTIVHYWDRFSKVVGHIQLWSILENMKKSDRLNFFTDGTPYNPPDSLVYLIKCEKEQQIISHISNHSYSLITIIFLGIIFLLIYNTTSSYIYKLKDYLQMALTKDVLI